MYNYSYPMAQSVLACKGCLGDRGIGHYAFCPSPTIGSYTIHISGEQMDKAGRRNQYIYNPEGDIVLYGNEQYHLDAMMTYGSMSFPDLVWHEIPTMMCPEHMIAVTMMNSTGTKIKLTPYTCADPIRPVPLSDVVAERFTFRART